jgi:deoxycytidylate deaminase
VEFGKNQDSLFLHAEVDAIKNALRLISVDQLSKSELYVVRVKRVEGKKGWFKGLAKPCEGCQRAIETFNLKAVHYTTDENTFKTCTCS